MKSMIYRGNAPFMAAFMSEAMAYSTTLKFTTREDYLTWVKKWKEDYKIVEHKRKIDVLFSRRDNCILPHKKEYYQKRIDNIEPLTDAEKEKYNAIVGRVAQSFGLASWMVCNTYWVVIALLVERKAGKIKANVQRNVRLLEQSSVSK